MNDRGIHIFSNALQKAICFWDLLTLAEVSLNPGGSLRPGYAGC